MKIYKQSFLIYSLIFFIPISIFSQVMTVNIADDYRYKFEAKERVSYNLNVEELLSECVAIFANPQNGNASVLNPGDNSFGSGIGVSTAAVSKLFAVPGAGGNTKYQFGNNCGEEGYNSASVTVDFRNDPISTESFPGTSTAFNLSIGSNIFQVESNEPRNYSGETFLRVNASTTNTATIKIDMQSEQGNVYICIIEVGGDNKTLAILNPKATSTQQFTAGQAVYVFPIIKPIYAGTSQTLTYEVGDPKVNGKIRVEEELD